MHRLFTPLLRRVYVLFAVILAVHYSVPPILRSDWNKERLYRRLLGGDKVTKTASARNLADYGGQEQLLRAMQSDSGSVREAAAMSLGEMWFNSGSEEARQMLQRGLDSAGQKEFRRALTVLTIVTLNYPAYAEAWNRRAVLFWQLGQFESALDDCRRVVILNPDNFFAWQEMGLCHMRLGNLLAAARSFRFALQINPHDRTAQRLLRRCEDALRQTRPQQRPPWVEIV